MMLSIHSNVVEFGKKVGRFKKFLSAAGAEILEPTNEFEMLRFQAEQGVGVAYKNYKGRVSFTGPAGEAWEAYNEGKPWSAGKKGSRGNTSPKVRTLLKRDGPNCFLCWKPLNDDITIEHLLSIAHKGSSHISNLVLTHADCNKELGIRSIMEKFKMREARRPPVNRGKGVDAFFPSLIGGPFNPPKQPDLTPEEIQKLRDDEDARVRSEINRRRMGGRNERQSRMTLPEALADMERMAEFHASQNKDALTNFPAYMEAWSNYLQEAGAEAYEPSQFAEGN